jgi:hypothetical protein
VARSLTGAVDQPGVGLRHSGRGSSWIGTIQGVGFLGVEGSGQVEGEERAACVGSDQWSPIGEGDEKVVSSRCSLLPVKVLVLEGAVAGTGALNYWAVEK